MKGGRRRGKRRGKQGRRLSCNKAVELRPKTFHHLYLAVNAPPTKRPQLPCKSLPLFALGAAKAGIPRVSLNFESGPPARAPVKVAPGESGGGGGEGAERGGPKIGQHMLILKSEAAPPLPRGSPKFSRPAAGPDGSCATCRGRKAPAFLVRRRSERWWEEQGQKFPSCLLRAPICCW